MPESDAAVARHLSHLALRNLRPATRYQRRRALARLRQYLPVDVLDADAAMLVAWYESFGPTVEPESLATELSHVRGFFKWALLEGLVPADPTLRLIRPRLPRRLPRPISEPDLQRALASAPDPERLWLHLAAYAGLRAYEIANLRRYDLMLDRDPPVLVVNDGKGGKQRVVPLARRVVEIVTETPMPPSGWIAPRRDGSPGPLKAWSVCSYANGYLRDLGIDATLHMLRHRFATQLYRQSHDLRLTQEVMGHASPRTTAGYAAWSPTEAAVAVEGIE